MVYPVPELQLLQLYRDAEYHGVELLQRLSRETDDPRLQIDLTRQMADETRHALLWTEWIDARGGTLVPPRRTQSVRQQRQAHRATAQLDLLTQLYVAEERLQQQYRASLAWSARDPHTVAMLHTILADEEWHCSWVKQMLADQAQRFGRTRVAAIVDSFWNA